MNNIIGNRIKTRREEIGMTQQELAERVGYAAKSSISLIESGRAQPPFDKILEIAQCLKCEPSYLLGASDDFSEPVQKWRRLFDDYAKNSNSDGPKTMVLSQPAAEVIMLMHDLPENEQWKMVGRIEAYVENLRKYVNKGEPNEKV